MEKVQKDIDDLEVYIENMIACFGNSFQDNMQLIDKVLSRLQEKEFIVNPQKCEWAIQETDFDI